MTYFQRVAFEPRPDFSGNFIQRLGGFLTARIQPLAGHFRSLKEAARGELSGSADSHIVFDALPESDVAKVCHILRATGSFRENATLLELGAASGVQTIEMATCGAFAHVLAVEPEAGNFTALQRNVDDNSLQDMVCCFPCAVGVIDGMTKIYVSRDDKQRSGMKQQKPNDTRTRTPISTIETILQDARVPAEQIGLVWIDIEGYEAIACLSMTRLMERNVPIYAVLSPELYHRDHGSSLIRYLATYYRRCVLLTDSEPRIVNISDIPLDQGSVRVLLID
ncbi:FkbM family methyltransferase [Phyllobacterium sp. LjRoot231]|uniref:FkbM family methyltransferase n=1 Tax=Phyllobacterium sp. LjRoot231 TaxID=3342289 RepID=UPI003ECC9A3C